MGNGVELGGISVQDLTYPETLDRIEALIQTRRCGRMVVTNASKTILAQSDPELRTILQESDLVTADGMSVVWAARFLGRRLRERVTGIDTMELLVRRASEKGYSVYFLGAKPEVVEAVVDLYVDRFPSLHVAGFMDGYRNWADPEVIKKIRAASPDILFVALGSPAQEKWIARTQKEIGVPFCLGVGGSFDHIAGVSKRAPVWMQNAGLEWFYRLVSEPRRLWQRYLVGNTKFIMLVLRQRLKQ